MNRIVPWLLALVAAGSTLWLPSGLAHGLHPPPTALAPHGDAQAASERLRVPGDALRWARGDAGRPAASASTGAQDLQPRAVLAAGSHCPPDDGLPCACGLDRCTNPQPPRIAIGEASIRHAAPVPPPTEAIGERRVLVVVRRSPPGSVGSRAPPAFS